MALRIEWDEYEIALLIDACNQVLNKRIEKSVIVKQLSLKLRERAESNGIQIDELFRNENGITLQMLKMFYLLTDGKAGLPGSSKLYAAIAEMSKTNPAEFATLLSKAKEQIGVKETMAYMSNKEKFRQWLLDNPPKKYLPDAVVEALNDASDYCQSRKLCKESLWDLTDVAEFSSVMSRLLGMRIYRLTHKNNAIILDKTVPLYKEYLKQSKEIEESLSTNIVKPVSEFPAETIEDDRVSEESVSEAEYRGPSNSNDMASGDAAPEKPEANRMKVYQKLYYISKVYDDPTGVPVGRIITLLGKNVDEQLVRNILDDVSWAVKLTDDVYSFSRKSAPAVMEPVTPYETTQNCVTETEFFKYLNEQAGMAEATCRSYVSAIRTVESYAKSKHYIPYKLYDCPTKEAFELIQKLLKDPAFMKFNGIQHNRFRAAFTKFSEMAGQPLSSRGNPTRKPVIQPKTQPDDFDKEKFEETLLYRYRNGMQFDSIDFDNFRETYDMLFYEKITFNDTELEERLRYCGVIYKDRLFPAEGIIDNNTREKLFAYIENSFASGKKVLYYKAIFEDLSDAFANCFSLSDENMLKAYIEYSAENNKYFFFSDYMSVERHVTIDHCAEVEEFLLNSGKPMLVDDVCAALSHIPQEQVRSIIHSDNRFLRNAKGEYFHAEIFEISDSEMEHIAEIINGLIDENEYAIWSDVWNEIQNKMPVFLENNLYLSGLGIRNAIAQKCSGKFNFESAVISLPRDRFTMHDVYQLFAKHHAEFTADDIYNLSKELDTIIYFYALAGVSVRVNHDLFVSKKQINFDVDAIDKAIGSFMSKDYIRLREIDSFLAFPNVGYEWNEYLLESFLLSYSKMYTVLNNGLALNNVAGAIVRKNGKIIEFVDVCAAVLADSQIPLNKTEALNYLAEVNIITRRSYRDLDEAIRKASQIRGRKD